MGEATCRKLCKKWPRHRNLYSRSTIRYPWISGYFYFKVRHTQGQHTHNTTLCSRPDMSSKWADDDENKEEEQPQQQEAVVHETYAECTHPPPHSPPPIGEELRYSAHRVVGLPSGALAAERWWTNRPDVSILCRSTMCHCIRVHFAR